MYFHHTYTHKIPLFCPLAIIFVRITNPNHLYANNNINYDKNRRKKKLFVIQKMLTEINAMWVSATSYHTQRGSDEFEQRWRHSHESDTTTRDDDDYGQSKKIVINIMLIICFHCNEFLLFYLLNQRDGKWVGMAHCEMEWGEKWGFVCLVITLIKKHLD